MKRAPGAHGANKEERRLSFGEQSVAYRSRTVEVEASRVRHRERVSEKEKVEPSE